MTKAIVANEQQMKDTEYYEYPEETEYPKETEYPEETEESGNAPIASERMHVGSKTPVLGSMDLVTGKETDFQYHVRMDIILD